MYIKRISIQGFKTFKNLIVIENLSPNENVIIGSNGSGKSNLFEAIKFVISEDYHNLSSEDRLSMIYQGSGTVISCFVELEFDSGIKIRRTIGLKKDEFSVNDRVKGKSEVKLFLQRLGFPFEGNNYFIVPQGKITSLTNAKDVERLKLLKEVTGASVFEDKLNKSLRDMQESRVKRERIDSELGELNTRLNDLNEEKKHLVQCQLLTKEKKLLQFSLFEKNLAQINEIGNNLQVEYDENTSESQQLMQQVEESEDIISNFKGKMKTIKNELKLIDALKTDELSDLQLEINDLEEKQRLLQSRIKDTFAREKEISDFKANISTKIQENDVKIKSLQPDYDSYSTKQQEFQSEISSSKQRQTYLITKQGRYSKFRSQEEKDSWVKTQITSLKKEQEELNKSIANLKIDFKKKQISTLNKKIENNDFKLAEELGSQKESFEEEYAILQDEYYDIVDRRTECWREEQTTKNMQDNIQKELDSLTRQLNEKMDRPTALGLSNLPIIMQDLKLTSNHIIGKIGDLIHFSEKYKQCIETTAGNALFNVVVDTDQTASKIMEYMANKKMGRISFMPLNRIASVADVTYPGSDEGDFIPLIKKIQFDKNVANCMKLIFARTLVVKELSIGVVLAKKYGLNAVTPDGDKVDGRGALTGGFNDTFGSLGSSERTSKLDSLSNLKKKKEELKEVTDSLTSLEEKLKQLDNEAETMNTQLQEITLQKLAIKEEEALIKKDQLQIRFEISNFESELVQLNETADNLQNMINSLQIEISILEKDLKKPFDKKLTDEEAFELKEIIQSLQKNANELNKIDEELKEKELAIEVIRQENEYNLKLQLKQSLEQESVNNEKLANYKTKLAIVLKKLDKKTEKEANIKLEVENSNKKFELLLTQKDTNSELLNEIYEGQKETLDKLEELQTKAEKLMTRITKNNNRFDILTNKIVELGFIPEESLTQFANFSEDQLVEKLQKVTLKLSKFTNVNKRAGESFARFLNKKEELENKAAELGESEKSIETLIFSLKAQKVQAIESTFQKVAIFFEDIFTKIVPTGKGQLIINKKVQSENELDSNDAVDNIYDGVAIQVSFNSKDNEQLFVDQLSGGQKTVCAIALILAIQSVNPAPFYLFDEVDAALDKEFRTSIAKVIHDLSHEGNESTGFQFICTTFRRELLNQADKLFRVRFENKTSVVEEIGKVDAILFVRGEKRQRILEI